MEISTSSVTRKEITISSLALKLETLLSVWQHIRSAGEVGIPLYGMSGPKGFWVVLVKNRYQFLAIYLVINRL